MILARDRHFSEYPTNQATTQKTSFRDHEHRELHAERESYARWTDSFPTLRQTPICLSFVPIRLLQNICNRCITESNPRFFHARRARARSRSAEINPFLRIWLIDTSIFGPFAAASSSCSRLVIRRSLSWRINSRMYSLGVPQSPVATWPST